MGFIHPERDGVVEQLGCDLDQRGNMQRRDLRDVGPRRVRGGRRAPRASR